MIDCKSCSKPSSGAWEGFCAECEISCQVDDLQYGIGLALRDARIGPGPFSGSRASAYLQIVSSELERLVRVLDEARRVAGVLYDGRAKVHGPEGGAS